MYHPRPFRYHALVLAQRARALREFSTISERKLWHELSGAVYSVYILDARSSLRPSSPTTSLQLFA